MESAAVRRYERKGVKRMSDRYALEVILQNVCEKIGEQERILAIVTDEKIREKTLKRLQTLKDERETYTRLLNNRYRGYR